MTSEANIIVLDRDPDASATMRRCLEAAGFGVHTLDSGDELRRVLRRVSFEVGILDLNLRAEDGLALLSDRHRAAAPPVLILTGKGETIDRVLGLEMGADEYVAKPFDPRELLARVRSVLRRLRTLGPGSEAERGAVLDAAPVPLLSSLLRACQHSEGAVRADCLSVGRKLLADEQGSVLSRLVGSVQVRRLSPQADEAAAAREFRRQYVWLAEQADVDNENVRANLRRDLVALGEWQALKNAVTAAGKATTPPPDWLPANPQTLLLPEQRDAAAR